ncbi:MAG: hypothetical protein A3F91_08395 [Flavobacteria bacterium RIFCSPLOWO2_12_FULL_35_11]|nr:MAG: hypothetical protein A3F91_08395 [Flavobacteria bacterium RIFCSPLOWO2_12_FULL_35_11]
MEDFREAMIILNINPVLYILQAMIIACKVNGNTTTKKLQYNLIINKNTTVTIEVDQSKN